MRKSSFITILAAAVITTAGLATLARADWDNDGRNDGGMGHHHRQNQTGGQFKGGQVVKGGQAVVKGGQVTKGGQFKGGQFKGGQSTVKGGQMVKGGQFKGGQK